MTVYRAITISCDWPGCYAYFDRGYLNLGEARKSAASEGWKNYRGLLDLCGSVDQAPDSDVDGRRRLRGHATVGHEPRLSPQGRSHVKVACSCGWPGPTDWVPLRVGAGFRWGEHIKKEATA